MLIENGADIELPNEDGHTALYSACIRGQIETCRHLIDKAELNSKNNDGWTPFHVASYLGHVAIVELLIEKGANIEILNNDGGNALLIAAAHGKTEVAMLLSSRMDLNFQNEKGWTPINAASMYGHVDIVRLLVDNGADVEIATKSGRTALYWKVPPPNKVIQKLFVYCLITGPILLVRI